jgi:hypothetical protein
MSLGVDFYWTLSLKEKRNFRTIIVAGKSDNINFPLLDSCLKMIRVGINVCLRVE